MSTKKLTKEDLKFDNPHHAELMRVVLAKFKEYDDRKQYYYELVGMSTSHITLKAIDDLTTLHTFWPDDEVEYDRNRRGNIYLLGPKTLTKVQTAVRVALEKLEKLSFMEKVGNEHERRWRPAKGLKGVTL